MIAVKDDLGAVATARVHLGADSSGGHHDYGVDAGLVRGQSHSLGVIAGGQRDHAGRALRRGERGHLVERAADLERAGLLQVLGLGIDAAVAHVDASRGEHSRRRRGGQNRRAIDAPLEHGAGFVESFERDDMVGHGESMAPGRGPRP